MKRARSDEAVDSTHESSIAEILRTLGVEPSNLGASTGSKWIPCSGAPLKSFSPVDGKLIATVTTADKQAYDDCMKQTEKAFLEWRTWPAPKRGVVVREFGDALRKNKEALGTLVSYEMGKSLQEGKGEVQEMIDICDFAQGLSRQLYGNTMHSERPGHRMYEQWHPLGIIGVITAFNFPVAVWSWNAALAWVCGDVCVWKPSAKTPLVAVACQKICAEVFKKHGVPEGVSTLLVGDRHAVGQPMVVDSRVPLISMTGSTAQGKIIASQVHGRLARTILELGGNNAVIITENADLKMAVIGCTFGAVGTAGQRCTSTRRLIVHEKVYDQMRESLVKAYQQIRIGDPLDSAIHMGPLIDKSAVSDYLKAIELVKAQGGKFLVEGGLLEGDAFSSGCYVKPCIAEVKNEMAIVQEETFAPILYLIKYSGDVDSAIALQNAVPQGLSSAIMTRDLIQAERFLACIGSDCGIANVNSGTSGAEIGGAFGGEKETGGGRESGSDVWKYYMRRQTNTINWTTALPLAQGITFDLS